MNHGMKTYYTGYAPMGIQDGIGYEQCRCNQDMDEMFHELNPFTKRRQKMNIGGGIMNVDEEDYKKWYRDLLGQETRYDVINSAQAGFWTAGRIKGLGIKYIRSHLSQHPSLCCDEYYIGYFNQDKLDGMHIKWWLDQERASEIEIGNICENEIVVGKKWQIRNGKEQFIKQ